MNVVSRAASCLTAALLLPVPALAADLALSENVTWAGSARVAEIPDLLNRLPAADAGTADNVVATLRQVDIRLRADSVEVHSVRVYRYGTEQGIRDFGNLQTFYDASADSVTIHHALVVDSQGRVHVVEPGTVQLLPSDTTDVFSDSRFALLPLTGLDVGSTAVVVDTVVTDRKRRLGPWGMGVYEQLVVPQGRFELNLSWEAQVGKPKWHSGLDNLACSESDSGLSCVAQDIQAVPTDEDAYFADVLPQFVVAEERSWIDIQAWYRPLFTSALTADATVQQMAAELADGLEDETEIVRAMHRFVATQVRYVGLEHGDSAFVPHPTNVTLARRYGDCKDKAALLIDLLRHSGIEMEPVLVATGRRNAQRLMVPSRIYFDHLIVCGKLTNGREYCLDGTDPFTGIDALSGWVQGAVALPVESGQSPQLLPAETYRWLLDEEIALAMTSDGAVEESAWLHYDGTYGSSIRRGLSGMSAKEMQDWALQDYHRTVSDRVDPTFEFQGVDDANVPLTIRWNAKYEKLLSPSEPLDYVEWPSWLNQAIGFLGSENEVFDYWFPGLQYRSVVRFNVDSNWEVNYTGADIDMRSRFGTFSRKYSADGQEVTVMTKLMAPAALIDVADLETFNRFLTLIRSEGALRVAGALRD